MRIFQVKGQTWVIETPSVLIPIYRLPPDGSRIILIDSGNSGEESQALLAFLEKESLTPLWILLTHTHFDHTGGNAALQQRWRTKIACPIAEAASAFTPRFYKLNYQTFTPAECEHYFEEFRYQVEKFILPTDQVIELDGVTFTAIPTPGHTHGHTAYITPDNVACLGDLLISEATLEKFNIPTGADRLLDSQSKSRIRELTCDAYVLSHYEARSEIKQLCDHNLASSRLMYDSLLACLQDGMFLFEWFASARSALGVKGKNDRLRLVFERNMLSAVEYLLDSGEITRSWTGTGWNFTKTKK